MWTLVSFLLTLLVIAVGTEMIFPGVTGQWVNAVRTPVTHARELINPVLPDLIQRILLSVTGQFFLGPLVVVPAVALALTLYSLGRNEQQHSLLELVPPLQALSILVGPYAWFYDYSLTLFIPVVLAALAYELPATSLIRRRVLFEMGALHILSFILVIVFVKTLWDFL